MIKIYGQATLKVRYIVDLKMTIEEFESLSNRKQISLIDEHIDWHSTLRNAELDDIDIWDIDEE